MELTGVQPYGREVAEFRTATAAETQAWQDDWNARLRTWYTSPDVPAPWVAEQVAARIRMQPGDGKGGVFAADSGGEVSAVVAVAVFDEAWATGAMITDLFVPGPRRRQGHGRHALRLAEDWARRQGAKTLWLLTDPAQPAHAALFAGFPIRSLQMIKQLSAPLELATGLAGRPMSDAEFAGWRAKTVEGYAADMANSGSMSAGAAAKASADQFNQLLPDGLGTPGHSFLCLEAAGEVVATNWICHQRMPGMSWVFGVEVSEGHRGRGYGRAAMFIGEQVSLEAGDTHLALNVFGQNTVAISMYESMGYRTYDQGRSAEL